MSETITVTREELTALLEQAAEAHHVYETERGAEDEAWALWYATYIFQETTGEG